MIYLLKNKAKIQRTLKHNAQIRKTAKEMKKNPDCYLNNKRYKNKMWLRLWLHDMDKVFSMLYMDERKASEKHKKKAKHHVPVDMIDYLEAILDWECSRHTKEDSPLTAWEYYKLSQRYRNQYENEIYEGILKNFGIWESRSGSY